MLDELYARLGKPVPHGEDEASRSELALAAGSLSDALAVCSTHGKSEWFMKPETLPWGVKAVVLAVAERRVRNPRGYVSETAGEYSYRRPEQSALGLGLTKGEIALIEKAAGQRGLMTVDVQRAVKVSHSIDYPYPNGRNPWDWADGSRR
ncbi:MULTISPECIES: hypothetical protein [Streptomyces]